MDYKEINKILELYFEGETTLEQEKLLKDYFSTSKIAPGHRSLKNLFDFYQEEKKLKNPKALHFNQFKRKRNYKLATAAVLILGLGIFGLLSKQKMESRNNIATTESKKEIFNEVKKYSNDLNKGIKQLSAFGFIGQVHPEKKKEKDTLKEKTIKKQEK